MATVLAYTSPAIGHLYPMMPTLLELAGRGHDVHVRTLPSQVGLVREAGLEAEPIDARIDPVRDRFRDWEARHARAALANAAGLFTERGRLDGPDLEQAVAEVRPDLLVVDGNCWGAHARAATLGIPHVGFFPYVLPIRSVGTPPFGPGLRPLGGPLGRLRDAVAGRFVLGAVAKEFLPGMNSLRTTYGARPADGIDEFFLDCDLMLVTTSTPFDYPHPDWPAHVHSIGQTAWEPPTDVPPWLSDLPGPLTLVTTSSEYQADEPLARAAIRGLADETGSLLVTMPAGVPDDFGSLPPHVRVERFVPHSAALGRSTVVVTHGGMGATQKALAHGVPVCVVPFGRDQHETAARVVHADAGTRLSAKRLTPERLRDAVRKAASKTPGAVACAAGYRDAGGAVTGANLVESLL